MITLLGINKSYLTPSGEIHALKDIHLTVAPGRIFGIIGRSGAGKSTLIRCANLLERPTSGQVIVDQTNLITLTKAELRQARHKIGMIFQHFNLLSSRTVYDNIALPLELTGENQTLIKERIDPLLVLTGLTDKKNHYPSQLSGGQQQRVAIARALAHRPKVLLSDEATSALDPETTQSILDLLRDIRDNLNITILLITHEMHVIKKICDQVAILEEGQLIEQNEVGDFFAHPKTDIAKNFIASSIKQELPALMRENLLSAHETDTYPVLRLWFTGETATQPILSRLVLDYQLQINVLQANVEYVQKHIIGIMIVAVSGSRIGEAKRFLTSNGLQIEVIGYAPKHIVTFD